MIDKLPDFFLETVFKSCNKQIDELHDALSQITQYVSCFNLIVPSIYKERVVNELELLNNDFDTPIAYELQEDPNNPDFCMVMIFNIGAMNKQAFLEGMK